MPYDENQEEIEVEFLRENLVQTYIMSGHDYISREKQEEETKTE